MQQTRLLCVGTDSLQRLLTVSKYACNILWWNPMSTSRVCPIRTAFDAQLGLVKVVLHWKNVFCNVNQMIAQLEQVLITSWG